MRTTTNRICLIVIISALSLDSSCSKHSLNRASAERLVLRHERSRYNGECDVSFLARAQETTLGASVSDLRANIGIQLGQSICGYSVEVTGISLGSADARAVVFTETKTYDPVKVKALGL